MLLTPILMFLLIGYSNLVRLLLFISDYILNVLPIQHTFNFLKCILSTLLIHVSIDSGEFCYLILFQMNRHKAGIFLFI